MIILIALAILAESYIPLASSKRRRAAAIPEAVQAEYASGGKHRAEHRRSYGSNAGDSYCLGCRWEGPYDEFDAHIPDGEQ
ncbi:hypothetical protein [Gordonia sp. UCD-TK1]|uniref:hypothetical protein n=1 Tax=Gordonia sp. UCD-TK1 TaxID=1857893 RepID=UPI00080E3B46|nr:hypothetical protein [Gordonia sp. UCD-TK1]OCH80193.1 hypothetical protein A9310_22485 [Gordonia sp. UCD-TK1]